MLKVPKSPELKLARGYSDPKSFVRTDGTEVLHGEDWKKRKVELWERCGGRCENLFYLDSPQSRCSSDAQEPHHRIKRSVRRIDNLYNLQALCHYHHSMLDPRKVKWSKP